MSSEIIVALLACAGTCVGSIAGILAANKLTTFRIEQLEKKVEQHNKVVERTAVLEQKIADIQSDVNRCFEKIRDVAKI